MVVFSCDGCGDMLKKSQVDSHAGRCRRCDSVSCVDCSVSFFGDDYRSHTSCVSEAQRYEKTMYRGKGGGGSTRGQKLNPQEAWMELIASAVPNAPPDIRHHFQVLSRLDNVPRKPKQFRNFTANSLNLRGRAAGSTVDTIWKYLFDLRTEQQQSKRKTDDEHEKAAKAEDTCSGSPPAPSEAIPETDVASDTQRSSMYTAVSSKELRRAMKQTLKKAPNRSMKVKSFQRVIRDSLGVSKKDRLAFKKRMFGEIEAYSSRLRIDGKVVTLTSR